MKKLKFFVFILLFLLTGCLENDTMEDIHIRTTAYPIQYIVERMYQDHSTIESIYPNGSTKEEKVSDKLLKDYSKDDLFIFLGLDEKEQTYFTKMREHNKKLKIIDASSSIPTTTLEEQSLEAIWLDPMNLLTVSNDIKKGFEEYTTSTYLINDINEKYQSLKQDLIQLDADYKDMAARSTRKTIVVSNDAFLYLKKYGIDVISLEENEKLSDRTIRTVKDLIKKEDIQFIYTVQGEKISDTIRKMQEEEKIELIELDTLYTRTEEEYNENLDYLNIMKNNLESLKKELYR